MAAEGNGRVAEANLKGANGHAPQLTTAKKRKGFSLFSTISRLLTWYSIFTVLFRCPATVDLLTDTSPRICRPYFHVRSTIAPHVEPYYDLYAAPYVDVARPYYDTLNQRVITPATVLGAKYGAPRVAQARAYGQAHWEKSLQPQVVKYQEIAKEKYGQTLAPHLEKTLAILNPYFDIAKTSALQTYYGHVLPTYVTVQPYAIRGYDIASEFTVNTAIPYSKWAWTTGGVFLDRTLIPKLRILYGENVEPQLVRIGERLGRYRDGKRLQAAVDEVDTSSTSSTSSISSPPTPVSSDNAQSSQSTASAESTEASTEPEKPVPDEKEVREKAQKIVADDLRIWQEKFAKAADEGSDYLEERITEITDRLIRNQAQMVGVALNIDLEEAVNSNLSSLKSSIISLVEASKDGEDEEEALNTAVRKAGAAIKEKALAVRSWKQSYDREVNSLVSDSASDTFEILDHIRDLGLQEIGMRWAWTDGITHKDWAKYHKLKTKFDEWRLDVENVVTSHPGVEKAKAASDDVESEAMGTAEAAAKELARLKETGRWKISVGDASDDWTTKTMPAPVAAVSQKVEEKVSEASEAILGTSQGTIESVASVASTIVTEAVSSISSIAAAQASNAQDVASNIGESGGTVASSISSSVIGTPQGSLESVISLASASASSVADQASSSAIGTQQGSAESVVSAVQDSASSIVDQAFETPLEVVESVAPKASEAASSAAETEPEVVEQATSSISSAASVASESSSSFSDDASSSISSASSQASEDASETAADASDLYDFTSSSVESLSEDASDATSTLSSEASSASSTASQKVWGGAVAQSVEETRIVFEDVSDDQNEEDEEASFSEKIRSLASEASDLFGVETVTALAEAKYSDALELASDRYDQARSIVSAQISGTPKPVHEEMFNSVESAYSDATSAANSGFQAALASASSAWYKQPQGALESASSVAASKLSEGLSAASARLEDGKSYVNALPTGSAEKQNLFSHAQDQYYAGIGVAHARYSEFIAAASSAILPTQTPWTESAASAASSNWESLVSQASSQIYSQPTPGFVDQHLSEAKDYAASAVDGVASQAAAVTDSASSQYAAVQALLNELVAGKEADFTESVYSRLSSAYHTGAHDASSAASSYASEVYEAASSGANAVFTPPPAIEAILDTASSRVNNAVAAASIQFYGTPKGAYELAARRGLDRAAHATSELLDVLARLARERAEAAQNSIAAAASSAQHAISEAIYGTSTGAFESATAAAADAYATAASYVGEKASAAVHGPEQGAVESAQKRLGEAVESARGKLAAFASKASENVEDLASSVSSAVESATNLVKDEL